MSARYDLVIPYGDNLDALGVGLDQVPTKKVVLLTPTEVDSKVMGRVRSFLSKRKVAYETRRVSTPSADAFFLALAKVKSGVGEGNLIVNVSVGTPLYSHILLCAAMATGVTAFGVFDDELVFLPVSCSITHGR